MANKQERFRHSMANLGNGKKVCEYCRQGVATLEKSVSPKYDIWICGVCKRVEPVKV